ncbi:unnamed protein product [Ectocarpus sp. 12 AP-2014]
MPTVPSSHKRCNNEPSLRGEEKRNRETSQTQPKNVDLVVYWGRKRERKRATKRAPKRALKPDR